MSELSEFLRRKLCDYGNQLDFSRATKVSPGTVTKWLSGENTPNFESCLIIAAYFDIDPLKVFKMVGKVDYYQLYMRHFRTNELQSRLHSRLQHLLDSGYEREVEKVLARMEERIQKKGLRKRSSDFD